MKTLIASAAVAAIAALAPALAHAQDAAATTGVYGTIGYANLNVLDLNLGSIQGRIGYRGGWWGVEGELMGGVKEDSLVESGISVDVKLKHSESIYAVAFLPVGENTDILGRIGYGNAEIEASAGSSSASANGGIYSYGIGFQHHFDGKNGVRIDWTRYGQDDEDGDVWSIAYSRRF